MSITKAECKTRQALTSVENSDTSAKQWCNLRRLELHLLGNHDELIGAGDDVLLVAAFDRDASDATLLAPVELTPSAEFALPAVATIPAEADLGAGRKRLCVHTFTDGLNETNTFVAGRHGPRNREAALVGAVVVREADRRSLDLDENLSWAGMLELAFDNLEALTGAFNDGSFVSLGKRHDENLSTLESLSREPDRSR